MMNEDLYEEFSALQYSLGYCQCGECHVVMQIRDGVNIDNYLYCKECAKKDKSNLYPFNKEKNKK